MIVFTDRFEAHHFFGTTNLLRFVPVPTRQAERLAKNKDVILFLQQEYLTLVLPPMILRRRTKEPPIFEIAKDRIIWITRLSPECGNPDFFEIMTES